MRITYLQHSGFTVELKDSVLIFDYYKGELPAISEEKKVYVFVSHAHYDHFKKSIFEWVKKYSRITYILSDDVKEKGPENKTIYIGPRQEVKIDGMTIKTLRSTDEGVAFLVYVEGKAIYHAGDLNWWHWEEETPVYNELMKRNYQHEIGKIDGEFIDIAFVPADPRLEKEYYWGIDYFMRHTHTKHVFPMHMWEKYEICRRLAEEKEAESYKDRIMQIAESGQSFEI